MADLGVKRFIHTDIGCDGTLTEPNFSSIVQMVYAIKLPIIAAGGTSSLNQLRLLGQLGVEGTIVGKALYTGDIDLKQALDTVNPPVKIC
jgi:phosphoribosylformimino-5-aminoimidazole carboxamide ribotide isomerase